VSIMPRIWKHIEAKLDRVSLALYGFSEDVIDEVVSAVQRRKQMNVQPVMLAAHALDPRFRGEHLTEAEWKVATRAMLTMAENDMIDRKEILNDLTEYRSKTGPVFGDDVTWEAVNTDSCSGNPQTWWLSYASQRSLGKVAVNLLSMPPTAAIVERCNKMYASQKTKTRNRLLPKRAAKLATVSYNLKIDHGLSEEPTNRQVVRSRRLNILALSTTSAADITPSDPEWQEGQPSSSLLDQAMTDHIDVDDSAAVLRKSVLDANDSESELSSDDDEDIDSEVTSNTSDTDSLALSQNASEDEDAADVVGMPGVLPIIGDWVAVKVLKVKFKCIEKKGKASEKTHGQAFMHLARIENIDDDRMYTVSFLKRHSDGSYLWPDKDDRSSVERDEIVIIKSPSEDIIPAAGARAIRVKLVFDKNDIEVARKTLDIPLANVH